jgi:hypothetical protein
MKKIGFPLAATVVIFFLSLLLISPIISSLGYGSAEGSYHAVTHAILFSLIFTVIVCTMTILDAINKIKVKQDNDKKQ